MYFTLIVIVVNLLVDLGYGYFNPQGAADMTETSAQSRPHLPPRNRGAGFGPAPAAADLQAAAAWERRRWST